MVRENAELGLSADFTDAIRRMAELFEAWRSTIIKIEGAAEGADLDALEQEAEELAREMVEVGRVGADGLRRLEVGADQSGVEVDELRRQVDRLEDELQNANRRIEDFSKRGRASFAGVKTAVLGIGSALAALGIGRAIRAVVEETGAAEAATAKLNATLAATDHAAGLTSEQLHEIASDLQSVTTSGDDTNLELLTLLTTFKNISGDALPEVLERSLDLAHVLAGGGGEVDAKSAALQLGKALNDPVQGISALSRAGVQFTESQKATIKSLVDTGDVAGAQAVILKELEGQVGGVARAARDNLQGALKAAQNAVGDLAEKVGEGGLSSALVDVANRLAELATESDGAAQSLGEGLGRAVTFTADTMEFLIDNLDAVKALLSGLLIAKATHLLLDYAGAALVAGRNVLALADAQKALAGSTAASTAATGKLVGPISVFLGTLAALTVNTVQQNRRQAEASEGVKKYRDAVDAANQVLALGNTLSEEAARKKMDEALAVRQATKAKLEEAEADLLRLQRELDSFDPFHTGFGGNPQRLAEQRELAAQIQALRAVIDDQRATLERANEEWAAAGAALHMMAEATAEAEVAAQSLDSVLEKIGAQTPESIQAAAASLTAYRDAVVSSGTVTSEQAALIVGKVNAIREAIALLPAEQRAGLGELSTELAGVEAKFAALLKSLEGAPPKVGATGAAATALGADAAAAAAGVGQLADQVDRLAAGAGVDPAAAKRVEDLEQSIAGLTERERELSEQPLDASGLVELQQVQDDLAAAQFDLREATEAVAAGFAAAGGEMERYGHLPGEIAAGTEEWVREQAKLNPALAASLAQVEAGSETLGEWAQRVEDFSGTTAPELLAAHEQLTSGTIKLADAARQLGVEDASRLEIRKDIDQADQASLVTLDDMKLGLDAAALAQQRLGQQQGTAADLLKDQVKGWERLTEEQRNALEQEKVLNEARIKLLEDYTKKFADEMKKVEAAQKKVIDGWKEMNRLCEEHRDCLTK